MAATRSPAPQSAPLLDGGADQPRKCTPTTTGPGTSISLFHPLGCRYSLSGNHSESFLRQYQGDQWRNVFTPIHPSALIGGDTVRVNLRA